MPCNCGKYDPQYDDGHHHHIFTGNLSIIRNNKLHSLFYKGPKFREPETVNFVMARETVEENLDSIIETLSTKNKWPKNNFDAWKNHILSEVDKRISEAGARFSFPEKRSIFHDPVIKE